MRGSRKSSPGVDRAKGGGSDGGGTERGGWAQDGPPDTADRTGWRPDVGEGPGRDMAMKAGPRRLLEQLSEG